MATRDMQYGKRHLSYIDIARYKKQKDQKNSAYRNGRKYEARRIRVEISRNIARYRHDKRAASDTGKTVGTVSRGQGRPSWGEVWRKPKAKPRSDEQELYIRHYPTSNSAGVDTNLRAVVFRRKLRLQTAQKRKGCHTQGEGMYRLL